MGQGDFAVDRLITQPWPAATPVKVWYVRPGGSDANDGLTALTAFATFPRAVREMNLYSVNAPLAIDVTGMTGVNAIAASEVLNLGGAMLGGLSFDLDFAATSPDNFFSRQHRQIRSELALVDALTVTGQAFDAVSGILTLTVADALVANALRGTFAVGAALGEYGVIRSNTGGAGPNTIEVCNLLGLTLPVAAYEPGATLRFGDAANFFEQAFYLLALCDWSLQGLFLESNGPKATALGIWPNASAYLTLCDISGLEVNGGSGHVTIDGCYVHDQTFSQDGASLTATQSYFRGLNFICHGSGGTGINEWIGCCIDACSTFGGGNLESAYQFEMDNCEVDSGTGAGVSALFGNTRLKDCVISNCAANGIVATGPVLLYLDNVQGAGNVGYGVSATYGPNVRNSGGTAITGTLNDVFVGALGAAAWGATPLTDTDQLVRVGA